MKALQKDTVREIKGTMSRFLSIVAIIALGISFFGGIKTTGPSMKYTANQYYQEQRLMDLRLVSTYGFQDGDVAAIKETPGVNTVMPSYSADVIIEQGDKRPAIKLMAQPASDGLNQPVPVEGRMPENSEEMLLEMPTQDTAVSSSSQYKLGDTVKLSPEVGDQNLSDSLNRDSFTIVGFVRSPQFVSIERGSTNIGRGELDYFGYIDPISFVFERYTEVYVLSQASADGVSAFTPEYTTAIEALALEMQNLAIERLEINQEDIQNQAEIELEKGRNELADAKQQFADGIAQGEAALADARNQLLAGEAELADGQLEYEQTIKDSETQLADAKNQIAKGETDLAQGPAILQRELDAGQAQLDQLRSGIAQMEAQNPAAQLPELEAQRAQLQEQIGQGETYLQSLFLDQAAIEEQILDLDPTAPDYQSQLIVLNAQLAVINSQIAFAQSGLETARAAAAQLQAGIDEIQAFQNQLAGLKEQLATGEAALAQAQIDGQNQLAAGRAALDQSKIEVANGEAALEAGKIQGQQTLDVAQNGINQGWAELGEGESQLLDKKAQGEVEINKAAQKLAAAEAEIAALDFGKWYVFNRSDNPGYTSYGEDAQRIDNMSGIFPIFFLLVAALVSFTTMTRMVEEQRTQIGTLKALGYQHYQIASKFFIYALLAAVLGSALGLALGLNTLPYLITSAYNLLYQMPDLIISIPWVPILVSCFIAILCTVTAAIAVSCIELREQPSQLMRPKAPKVGKRILLERMPFIWKRMGFIEKVTARNLMRYKGRFFMTVIGIAGCTALILAGFGLQDAIFSMIPKQFNEISVFDGTLAFKTEGTVTEKAATKAELNADSRLRGNMLASQTKINLQKRGNELQKPAYLFIPEATGNMQDFLRLQDRKSGDPIDLEIEGVVLSEKMAKVLDVAVGDTIIIASDDESHEVTLGAITENYLENFIYLSPTVYEQVFGRPLKVNSVYFNLLESNPEIEDTVAKDWLDTPGIVAINYTGNIVTSTNDSLSSLNIVVLVMLFSAGALAVVVLYNLTNINISERVREIATIRVLGFYDSEVYTYIFRENIVLSGIGIAVGLVLGVLLNGFIINTVETEIAMFGRGIELSSFLYAIVFTMLFTMLVNIIMTPMIKRISMVESLKSIE